MQTLRHRIALLYRVWNRSAKCQAKWLKMCLTHLFRRAVHRSRFLAEAHTTDGIRVLGLTVNTSDTLFFAIDVQFFTAQILDGYTPARYCSEGAGKHDIKKGLHR